MKSLFVRCCAPLLLSLVLGAAGCRSADRSGIGGNTGAGGTISPAGRGGSGGRGGTGGRGGAGGNDGTGGISGMGGSAGGTGGGTGGGAGGMTAEAGADLPPAEAGEAGVPDMAPVEVGPMPDMAPPPDAPIVPGGCGMQVATATTMGAVEGLVAAPDGTIYFSQGTGGNFIGRIRPGMPVERNWLATGGQVFGITYDPRRRLIYAGRRTGGAAVLKVDVGTTPPIVATLAAAQASINGVTLGEDEAVYYADEMGRGIRRITFFGQPSVVNATALPGNPSAIAFGPRPNPADMGDSNLYLYVVYASGSNEATRLRLTNGGETGRAQFINNVGAAGAEGAAFDERGRLYVTAGNQLRRISPQAMGMPRVDMMMASMGGTHIEFGIGALSCNDVYVGSANAGIRRYTMDAKGWNVPWHRP